MGGGQQAVCVRENINIEFKPNNNENNMRKRMISFLFFLSFCTNNRARESGSHHPWQSSEQSLQHRNEMRPFAASLAVSESDLKNFPTSSLLRLLQTRSRERSRDCWERIKNLIDLNTFPSLVVVGVSRARGNVGKSHRPGLNLS